MAIREKIGVMFAKPHIAINREAQWALNRTFDLHYNWKLLGKQEALKALADIDRQAKRTPIEDARSAKPPGVRGCSSMDPETFI